MSQRLSAPPAPAAQSARPTEPFPELTADQAAPGRLRSIVASQFGEMPQQIWILFVGVIVNRLGYLVTPFLVFYLGSRGVPAGRMPYVLGALGAGNLVGPAIGGLLADRVGRRPTMLAGLLATAVSQGLLYAAPNVATLALAAALLSMSGSMVPPAAFAILTDTVAPERRRSAFSLFSWAINIGTAVSGAAGGFLAAHGYWLLFVLDAGTSLLYAGIVYIKLPADRAPKRSAADGSGRSGGYGVLFGDRLLLALLPLFGVQLLIYSLTEVALPLAVHANGLAPTTLGLMYVINAGLVVALQPSATKFLSRYPQSLVYAGASLLITAGIALTGLAHRPSEFAMTVVLWSIGEASVSGISASIIANLAPADARGRYQGAFSWIWGVARFTALTAGAAVYTDVSPALLWWSSAVAGALAAGAILALTPAIARRTEQAKPTEQAAQADLAPAEVAEQAEEPTQVSRNNAGSLCSSTV